MKFIGPASPYNAGPEGTQPAQYLRTAITDLVQYNDVGNPARLRIT